LWEDPSDEKEEKIIKRTAETIYKYEMDLVAILFLESMKPLASVGGQLARYMVAPFIPFIGDKSLPFFATFQNKENVERLIKELEEKGKQEEEEKKRLKQARKAEEGESPKKGWRKYLPF
jgi:hypothetical protein